MYLLNPEDIDLKINGSLRKSDIDSHFIAHRFTLLLRVVVRPSLSEWLTLIVGNGTRKGMLNH